MKSPIPFPIAPESKQAAPRTVPSENRPGRDGLLRLAFERQQDNTILRRCRYKLPLQILSPLALEDGTSYLLLLNPTGGVLGGDRLRTEIELEEGARVCLSTPSATRIYRTNGAPAEIDTLLRIGRNATLEYLPDQVVPHAGSSLRQSLRIEMAEGSRGIFIDIFAAGRAALNERWNFREYDSRTEILLRGKPAYLNRTKIIPGERSPASLGCMSNYCYSGSLLVIADELPDWRPVVASLRSALESFPGVYGGASLLGHGGCSVRYVAECAVNFHHATQRLWTVARERALCLGPLDLRKY